MSLKYKGCFIQAKPLQTEGLWQLEIEHGKYIHTRSIGSEMTFKEAEEYAFNEIDKLVKEEDKR